MSALARIRYLGLAASVALAAAAYLTGALDTGDPAAGLRTGGLPAISVNARIGLALWLAGAVGLIVVWWRGLPALGGLEGGRATRWTLVTGALWALPLLVAPPLASRDVYAYACQGWLWQAGADPYAIGVAAGGCPWAAAVPQLWQDTPTPYGPLAVLLSGGAAALGDAFGSVLVAFDALRVVAIGGLALLAVFLPRLARGAGTAPATALWLGLVTPLIGVHALSGAHNDALVAGLLVAALGLAVAGGRQPGAGSTDPPTAGRADPAAAGTTAAVHDGAAEPAGLAGPLWRALLAGVLLAGAVAIKVTALAAAPFLLVLLARRWWQAALAGLAGFIALTLASGLDLGWLRALRGTGELVQWSSAPSAVGMTAGYLLRAIGRPEWEGAVIAAARTVGLAALAVVAGYGLLAAWRARTDPPTVLRWCGIVLAATALLGPVFYPWYAIAPVAVLAATVGPGIGRRLLRCAVAVCTLLALPNGLGVPVLTKAVGAVAVTIGVALTIWWLARRARSTATA